MIKVIAVMTAHEGKDDALFEEFQKNIVPTRAEAGCIMYNLYRDPKTPTRFFVDEEWESMDHLKAHAKSAHLLAYREATKDMVASREVNILDRVA